MSASKVRATKAGRAARGRAAARAACMVVAAAREVEEEAKVKIRNCAMCVGLLVTSRMIAHRNQLFDLGTRHRRHSSSNTRRSHHHHSIRGNRQLKSRERGRLCKCGGVGLVGVGG